MTRSTLVALLLALASATASLAAPIPPARPARAPAPLSQERLVGTWVMHWGAARYTLCLNADGGYSCHTAGLTYVGSWGFGADGKFWFIESCRPQDPDAWRRYTVKLCPKTLSGALDTGTQVTIRLEKECLVRR